MHRSHLSQYFLLLLLGLTVSCTIATPPATPDPPTPVPAYIDSYHGSTTDLRVSQFLFSGKVVNKNTGAWENDRLVLLFLKGKEIARGVSQTMELKIYSQPESPDIWKGSEGVMDGIFYIIAPNTYKLTLTSLGVPAEDLNLFNGSHVAQDKESDQALATWMDPFYEGDSKEFYIPSKNIRYTIMILPGPISQLPEEIQMPGSVALIEGNRLVAIDPNGPAPEPKSAAANDMVRFDQELEEVVELPPILFPIDNCSGAAPVKVDFTQTYIHEIIDETRIKLGIDLPLAQWLKLSAEIEHHYGISDQQITTVSTHLTVPAGNNIKYIAIHKKVWGTGMVIAISSNVEVIAPYRILKNEIFEIVTAEPLPCP
jgi:hypothetical protein